MGIPDRELIGTIRFAVKATRELNLMDFQGQETAIAKLGAELGHEVAKSLFSKKRKVAYAALASFWNECGLGSMVMIQTNPMTIRLNDCYDCNASRNGGAPACTFKKSLIETIVQDSLGTMVHADELECCKRGGTGACFD